MLRLCLRPMILGWLLWLALSSGLIFAAQQPLEPDDGLAQYGFGICDLPCWAGITPGQTEPGYILPLLELHLPSLTDTRVLLAGWINVTVADTQDVQIRYGSQAVQQISFLTLRPSLYALLTRLGMPTCVLPVRERGTAITTLDGLTLIWEREGLTIYTIVMGEITAFLASEHLTAENLLIMVPVTSSLDGSSCLYYARWRGFAPIWFYWQQLMK